MTRCDKDVIIVVKGMPDSESNPAYVAVAGQVWRFNEVSEEYFISPFLGPELRYIHCGRRNIYPRPCLPYVAEKETPRWWESPHCGGESLLRLLALMMSYLLPAFSYGPVSLCHQGWVVRFPKNKYKY